MNIVGKWKYTEMTEKTGSDRWMPMSEFLEKYPGPTFEMLSREMVEFRDDGKMITYIAKDQIPKSLSDTMSVIVNASEGENVVMKEEEWKTENGRLYKREPDRGLPFIKQNSEWEELPVQDGKIVILGMSRLEKAE